MCVGVCECVLECVSVCVVVYINEGLKEFVGRSHTQL